MSAAATTNLHFTNAFAGKIMDDPALQQGYTHFQESMCSAYGLMGAGTLREHLKLNATLTDTTTGSVISSGRNSRDDVVSFFETKIANTKKELPTLAKVLINTTEYHTEFSSSGATAMVKGKHVVHFKSSGFTRATDNLKEGFSKVGNHHISVMG